MKSRIRYTRLSLAAISGIVVWLVYAFWPSLSGWRLAGQSFAGLAPSQNAIFTVSKTSFTNNSDAALRVNAWELQNGQPGPVIECRLPELDTTARFNRFLLSPDASLLAVYVDNNRFVQLISMEHGKAHGPLIYVDDALASIGFSSDGRLLSLNTSYYVRVWDTTTLKMTFDYKLNKSRQGGEQLWNTNTKTNRTCFSKDGRYLAVDTSINVHVFDLEQNKLVGTANETGVPRFHHDGKTLLVMPFMSMPARFHMAQDEVRLLSQADYQLKVWESPVDVHDLCFATMQKGAALWPYPEWLPKSMGRKWLEWNNQWGWPHLLRLRDIATGRIIKNAHISVTDQLGYHSGELMNGFAVRVSDDLQYAVVEDRQGLAVWNISGSRGALFWLTEIPLSSLALYFLITSLKRAAK